MISADISQPGEVRRGLVETLWYGQDPLAGYPAQPLDREGWNFDHLYLTDAIDHYRPAIVVEIGVWKGASVLTMARRMREIGCHGVVIGVDTWLGSAEHWLDRAVKLRTPAVHGYPLLYFTFLGNVAAEGLQEYVLPLPLDSINASEVLWAAGIRPSVLHIDAGHDYDSVTTDLEHWWRLLLPGGVDDFRARTPHVDFAALPYKCRFSKPA